MISLEDPLWRTLDGGYKTPYDASIPLNNLEVATDEKEIDKILDELWGELHHQGDVGIASYLAVPQLARIAATKDLYTWRLLGICSLIEQQRRLENNPQLPDIYTDYYADGLKTLNQFIVSNINSQTDDTTFTAALSLLAACQGRTKLSKAIDLLEGDVLEDFLEQF